jgi:hypothetical protein
MMGCFSDGPYSSPAKAKSIFDGRRQAKTGLCHAKARPNNRPLTEQMNGAAAVQPSNVKKSSCIDLSDKNTKSSGIFMLIIPQRV